MNSLMAFLLIASAKAAVLVVLVLVANLLLSRWVAARWRYLLWGLVALRLVLPPCLPSETSLFNLLAWEKPVPATVQEFPLAETAPAVQPLAPGFNPAPVARPTATPVIVAAPVKPVRPAWHLHMSAWTMATLVWLGGMLALLAVMLSRYWKITARIRRQAPVSDPAVLGLLAACQAEMRITAPIPVIETTAVQSPALLGIFRPRLLLPQGMTASLSRAELRHVILHELAHLRSQDVAINWLAALIQAAHWFNPLVWLAFRRMRQDQELACDEAVLATIRPEERGSYGRTLVNLTDYCPQRATAGLVGIIEKPGHLARRIEMIGQYRQPSRIGHWLAALVLLGLGAISLTEAVAQDAKKPKAAAATKLTADNDRFYQKLTLPGNRGIVVVSEGDFEPRSQGSYSLQLYGGANPEFPLDDFLAGKMRPRENGAIEQVLLKDIDGDGQDDVIVTLRCIGNGSYLSAEAFSVEDKQLVSRGGITNFEKDADVVKELRLSQVDNNMLDSAKWRSLVEALVMTGDGLGHHPELGSEEWRRIIDTKLFGQTKHPAIGTEAWFGAVNKALPSYQKPPSSASEKPTPEALIAGFYHRHDRANTAQANELYKTYFSAALAQLIAQDETNTPEGKVGKLDFCPLYDAQDLDIKKFSVGKAKIVGKTAEIVVSFENGGKATQITYSMEQTQAGWQIGNLTYADKQDLVSILKGDPSKIKIPEAIRGTWVITGHCAPGVSALSTPEANAWIGKTLVIADTCIALDGEKVTPKNIQCKDQNAKDYFDGFKVTPAAVGCTGKTVREYTVFDGQGGTLIMLGPDQALTTWDGVFFKLTRQAAIDQAIVPGFLGKWNALSKNHDAISGDLTVDPNLLSFVKKGKVKFEIIRFDGQEYILKLSKVVDSGLFMRLGPIQKNGQDEDMEVAYYKSLEKALAPRKDRTDNATSWGIYTRQIPALVNTSMRSQPKKLKEELDFAGQKETVTILDSNGNGKIEPLTFPRDPDGFLDLESRSGKSGRGDYALVGTMGVPLDMPFMKHGALWTLSVTADNRIQLQRLNTQLTKFAWQGKGSMPSFLLAGKTMLAGSMFEKEDDHWLVPVGDYRLRQFSYQFDENLSFVFASAEPGRIVKLEAGQTQTFGPVTEATAKVAITGTDTQARKVNFTVKTLTPDGYAIAIKTGIMKGNDLAGPAFRILDSAGKEVHKGHADYRNESAWMVPPELHGDFTIEPVFDTPPPFKVTIETAKITMPPANTTVPASGTPLAVPPKAVLPMETAPDFSRYPQTEAFKSFTERPVADNTLLDITAFLNNDRIALRYMVPESGEAINVREVYDWAHQDMHGKPLSAAELKSLREAIRQLPAKNAYPPLDQLVIVRFRQGTTWTSRSFDNLALPEPMRRIYDIIGEREESKQARMAQTTGSDQVPLKTISIAEPPNIEIDREKCAALGVSVQKVVEAIGKWDKQNPKALDAMTVETTDGKKVRLRDLTISTKP